MAPDTFRYKHKQTKESDKSLKSTFNYEVK